MAAASFESWLSAEVRAINGDEEAFVPYIMGILDEDDDDDDTKAEAIGGILEGISSDDSKANANLSSRILAEWKRQKSGGGADAAAASAASADGGVEKKLHGLDLNAQLASITDHKTAAYAAARASASTEAPDKSVKEAILAQYAGAVEESDDEDEGGGGDGGGGGGGVELSNLNAESVAREEQEKREKSRQAAMAKKEKDKEDRDKQKKQAEDRKKKAQEKAAKGERRR